MHAMLALLCAAALALSGLGATLAWAALASGEPGQEESTVTGSGESQGPLVASVPAQFADALAARARVAARIGSFLDKVSTQAEDVPVVVNEATGLESTSLQYALATAQSGDTLRLVADFAIDGAVQFSSAIVLDLAGHDLAIRAYGSAGAGDSLSGAALVYTGVGAARLADSAATGSLTMLVGAPSELRDTTYQGIAAIGPGGSLTVDGCAVSVVYGGATTSTRLPIVTLNGVAVGSAASFAMTGAASLNVRAAANDGDYGAATATGVYALRGAGSVAVDADAAVRVANNAAPTSRPSVGGSDVAEVSVQPGDPYYDALQDEFFIQARYDSNADSDGREYGTEIYYATSLAIAGNVSVSAYSDPVPQADAGKRESVVATHVFAEATATAPQEAYGLEAQDGFSGTVSQAGSVEARTGKGDAFAVRKTSSGAWSLDEARLSAACGADAYFVFDSYLDLRNFIDFGGSVSGRVIYVSQNNPEIGYLKTVLPMSATVAMVGQEYGQTLEGGLNLGAFLGVTLPDTVTVTFSNVHAPDGSEAGSQAVSVEYGKTLAEAGAVMPAPSDYVSGSQTYRFVGWRVGTAKYCYDQQTLYDTVEFDKTVSGARNGATTLRAYYVPVGAGERLVTFKVDYALYAYAASAGSSPSYADCISATSKETVPDCLDAETGYLYTFKGWAPGYLPSHDWSEGVGCLNADALPAANSDAYYTALYDREIATVALVFGYMAKTMRGYVFASSSEANFDWRQDGIEAANKRVRVGDTYTSEGVEYTFLGWSTRRSDSVPMFVDSLPVKYSDMMGRARVVRYGIYASAPKIVDVDFYVDGKLYAQAANVEANKTISSVFASSTNAVTPSREGDDFKGWNTSPQATTFLLGDVKTIGSALPSEDASKLELHAIWASDVKAGLATVSFYDDDRSTVLLRLADMPRGMTVAQYYGEDYAAPSKSGKVFVGWFDEDGNQFHPADTVVDGDITVYARYRTENRSVGSLSASSSLSGGASVGGAAVRAAANVAGASAGILESSKSSGGSGGDSASGSADGFESADDALDGNVAAFIAVQVALLAVVALALRWFVNRRRDHGEKDSLAVAPPEMEAIRF